MWKQGVFGKPTFLKISMMRLSSLKSIWALKVNLFHWNYMNILKTLPYGNVASLSCSVLSVHSV